MLTVAYMGEGGVENGQKHAYVICGRPLISQYIHSSFEMKKSGDQFPRKVTTCFRHYKPKLILPLKSVLLYNIPFTLKMAFEIMKLFKMHQIIKLTCPNGQLFIKITFAFIKIFDFLVKIAIFGAFLFPSRDSRHALLPKTNARSWQ